ncbi:uncharacterized protein [Amphiura filiformis]|uniref:uncharacterized protein n=1 Tax=Amphiura filiformis TaxID=82378 RepID=UPI003B21C9F8
MSEGYVIYLPIGLIVFFIAIIVKCCIYGCGGQRQGPSRPQPSRIHSVYLPRDDNTRTVQPNQRNAAQQPQSFPAPVQYPPPSYPPPYDSAVGEPNKGFSAEEVEKQSRVTLPATNNYTIPPWLPPNVSGPLAADSSRNENVSIPVASDMNPSVESPIITSVDQQPSHPPPSYEDTIKTVSP